MKKVSSKDAAAVTALISAWSPARLLYAEIPRASVVIFHKGKVLFEHNAHEPHRIASVSKIFTAYATTLLVRSHKVSLKDKVSKYVPWFAGGSANKVTITDLLSHTSGLMRDGSPHWNTGKFVLHAQSLFSKDAFVHQQKKSFKYSNYGYAVLGEVLSAITKQPFATYLDHSVFKPIGLAETRTDESNLQGLVGYTRHIPGLKQKAYLPRPTYAFTPAAGLVSTAADLATFIRYALKSASGPLMSRKIVPTPDGYYGLGLEIGSIKRRRTLGHSGSHLGFVSELVYDLDNDLGVVCLSNALDTPVIGIGDGILEAFYTYVDDKERFSVPSGDTDAYEGTYRDEWSDGVMAKLGKALVDLHTKTNNPLRDAGVFRRTTDPHTFVYESKNGYGIRGERVVFRDFRAGKAHEAVFGASLARRVVV